MQSRSRPIDRILFWSVVALVGGGVFIFLSASLGLLAREGISLGDVALSQLVIGLGFGSIACYVISTLPYRYIRKYALPLYVVAIIITSLVFVPGIGLTLNGATRWLSLGPLTFQPAELLKIAYILYLATWLSAWKSKLAEPQYGIIPFLIITAIAGVVLLLQPDTDTFFIIAAAGVAMYLVSGAKIRDIAIIILIAVIGIMILIASRPYLLDRFLTYLDPSRDPQGSSYQLQQSLLAVGAGEIVGRGFGQSIQKFGKLPEPISDSIFSVFAEEFGFIGSATLVLLFLTFALRGMWVAARAPDLFGGLLTIGIVTIISVQSFLNISAMLGIVPLSGLPLVFISHGGSALLLSLIAVGIVFSVSRAVR